MLTWPQTRLAFNRRRSPIETTQNPLSFPAPESLQELSEKNSGSLFNLPSLALVTAFLDECP